MKPGFIALYPSQRHKPWLCPGVSVLYKACLPARGLLYILLARVSLWFCSGHRGSIFFLYIYLYLWVDGSFAFVNPWRPGLLPSLLGGDGACAPPSPGSHSADAVL